MSSIPLLDLENMINGALSQEHRQQERRRSNAALKELICNPEIAKRLAGGESVSSVAHDLGVRPQTVRRWMKQYQLDDLVEVEARRILRAMGKRDLSKEKYGVLARALTSMTNATIDLRNGKEPENAQIINQTFINRVDIALHGQRSGGPGPSEGERVATITTERLRELPEYVDTETEE